MEKMDQNILYNYFKGNASKDQLSEVRRWVEADQRNKEYILKQRELYDIIQWMDVPNPRVKTKNTLSIKLHTLISVAAIVVFVFLSGIYFLTKDKKDINLAMNSISVPAGQRVNLVLSDGTQVWLNSRTVFSYPSSFSGDLREVYLNGEAFFDVTKTKDQKFIVHTDRCNIEVFGTKFNVEAYADSDDLCTALLEGSVKIINRDQPENFIMLSPDNRMEMNKKGEMSSMPIEDYDLYRWRDGLICFKNTNFKELMNRFEKCYGIRIVIENEKIADYECSGKFRISDGIDYALRLLRSDAKYTFERNDDDTVIYIK